MTTANLLQGAPPEDAAGTRSGTVPRDDAMSFGSAVRALLEGARVGRARAATPGDRWLMLRIEEALRGFDEIRQMATDDRPEAPLYASDTARTPMILAPQARNLGRADSAA